MNQLTVKEYLRQFSWGGLIKKGLADDQLGQVLQVDPRADNAVRSELFDLFFGNAVYSTLNNQNVTYNLLPNYSIGTDENASLGWRLHTERGKSTKGVGETDRLPVGTRNVFIRVGINPNFVVTRVAASLKHELMEELSNGVANGLAIEREAKVIEHAININERLVAPSFFPCSGYYVDGTSGTNPTISTTNNPTTRKTPDTAAEANLEAATLLRAPAELYRYIYEGDTITLTELKSGAGNEDGTPILAKDGAYNFSNSSTNTATITNANGYGTFVIEEVTEEVNSDGDVVYTTIKLENLVADGASAYIAELNMNKLYVASVRSRKAIHSLDDVSGADHRYTSQGTGTAFSAVVRPRVYNLYQDAGYGTRIKDLNDTVRTVNNGLGGYVANIHGDNELTTQIVNYMRSAMIAAGSTPNVLLGGQETMISFGDQIRGGANSGTSPVRVMTPGDLEGRPANMTPGLVPPGDLGSQGFDMTAKTLNALNFNTDLLSINGANIFADPRIPGRFYWNSGTQQGATGTDWDDVLEWDEKAPPVYVLCTIGQDGVNNLGLQTILRGRIFEGGNPIYNDRLVTDGAIVSMMELCARRMNVLGQINGIAKNSNLAKSTWDLPPTYRD